MCVDVSGDRALAFTAIDLLLTSGFASNPSAAPRGVFADRRSSLEQSTAFYRVDFRVTVTEAEVLFDALQSSCLVAVTAVIHVLLESLEDLHRLPLKL